MEDVKIGLKDDTSPITLEIASDNGSLGSFVLAYTKKGESILTEFGREPRQIAAGVPLTHLIPIEPKKIAEYRVMILGCYIPAPGVTAVKVRYSVIQDAQEIKAIEVAGKASEGLGRFAHNLEFGVSRSKKA